MKTIHALFLLLLCTSANAGTLVTSAEVSTTSVATLASTQTFTGSNTFSSAITGAGIAPKFGATTRDVATASGTQAITGVGFKPSMVIIQWAVNATADKAGTCYTNATTKANWHVQNGSLHYADSTYCIIAYYFADSGKYYEGVVSSLDTDGFTMTWTRTGAPTGTINWNWIAYR